MSKDNVVVGFVGLGTKGGRMAANVQRAGFKLLVVHDLHRQVASHHLAAGAIWADSPRALAREADVIFSYESRSGETASSLALMVLFCALVCCFVYEISVFASASAAAT
jgi:phosphoglycerate dehydrogenase-like enzyme